MLIDDMTSEWKDLGAVGINSDMPAGISVRYAAEFEQLQAELQKLDSLSPSTGTAVRINWQEVIGLSTEILTKKSKDLVVAGFLCRALFEVQGYPGLSGGLQCLHGMVSRFWDVLYPETSRMRGRLGALAWISAKVGLAVVHRVPAAGEREALKICDQLVDSLETLLSDKFKDNGPKFTELRDALRAHARNIEFDEPSAAPASSPRASSPAILPSVDVITSLENCGRAVATGADLLWKAASFARSQDSVQPWPYRTVRVVTWLQVDALPAQVENTTRIPPPPPHLTKGYQALIVQQAWKELINQAEEQVRHTPFWLDLHRYCDLALSRLGPSHAHARHAVTAELIAFLHRFPEILEYRFSDGTPFADEETQSWIDSELLSAFQSNVIAIPAAANDMDGCTDLRAKAQELMQAGQFRDALSVYVDGIANTTVPRRQFRTRLDLVQLCLDAGHVKIALSHLDILDRQLKSGSLETWEPMLAREVLHTLWAALQRCMPDGKAVSPDTAQWAEDVYKRLCRLDALGVIELEGKKKTGFLSR
jgi:type VI secretion system protein VasJ